VHSQLRATHPHHTRTEANKEEIGCSCFKKLYKLFTKSPNESVREYALQTIAHLATTRTLQPQGACTAIVYAYESN
jgi:hypothetical protein